MFWSRFFRPSASERNAADALRKMETIQVSHQGGVSLDSTEILNDPKFIEISNRTKNKVMASVCTVGETCFCGSPASHKVEEVIFHDDPYPMRHPYTSYICDDHFKEIFCIREQNG